MKKLLILFLSLVPFIMASCTTLNEIETDQMHPLIYVDLQDTSNHVTTILSYPMFRDYEKLNNEIEHFIGERWNNIKEKSDVFYENEKRESEFIVESTVTSSSTVISVLLNIYEYTMGSANGETIIKTFNYDTKTNTFIDIKDASGYSYEELASWCEEILINELHETIPPEVPLETLEELNEMIVDGIKANSETFSEFTLNNSLLTIYLKEGTVAPRSEGVKQITISVNK